MLIAFRSVAGLAAQRPKAVRSVACAISYIAVAAAQSLQENISDKTNSDKRESILNILHSFYDMDQTPTPTSAYSER